MYLLYKQITHAHNMHIYILDKFTSNEGLYDTQQKYIYDLLIIYLPFPLFNTGAMFALCHFSGTLIPKFSKKTASNPETASKFFMDPDVKCNQHKTRTHTDIHISILILVPSDFHCFRVSTYPSFNNNNFVSCLRADAPYNKLSKKLWKKSTFVEFCWTNSLCCRMIIVLSWPSFSTSMFHELL